MIANNRLHMVQLLDDRMTRTRAARHAGGAKSDSSHVKTYLLEAVLPENATPRVAGEFIQDLLPRASADDKHFQLVAAASDTVVSVQTRIGSTAITAYLDFTNPRFWLLHSVSDSDKLDRLVGRWLIELPELDRAWLPAGFLERCDRFGSIRGIGLLYDRRWLSDEDAESTPVDILKMQLRGRQAQRLLNVMRTPAAAPHETSLAKVTIRLREGFGVDDIKYDGKITGRGRSFQDHLSLAHQVYSRYADHIRRLERDFAIGPVEEGNQIRVGGEPISFRLNKPIDELPSFCAKMFSGAAPFRLSGLPVRLTDSHFTAQAIDVHSGRSIGFELTPTTIRVYLPRGACGNAIMRFYTNLQQRFDAMASVEHQGGGQVFEF